MDFSVNLAVAFLALLIERLLGYPAYLLRRIGHPVEWMGQIIARLDSRLNRRPSGKWNERLKGCLALLLLLLIVAAITVPLALALRQVKGGWIVEAVLATSLLAQSDLRRYVAAVADGLDRNLAEGQAAVSHIVGRDPEALDESGVARAALESLAENTSDAIVAPAFWLILLGLPGIALYKAINTADSMIGHKAERYLHFGWAAARIDDLVNLPCSRLAGFLFAGAASLTSPSRGADAFEIMMRDAKRHFSPNAGWPEAALAGALRVRLGGPRFYGGIKVDLPWIGSGSEILNAAHIRDGLRLQARTLNLFTILVAFGAMFSP
ncbi:MAG: adenosylcobinamide-phosphate synthase CbiB [Aestuariivirgaceae bacterium]